jgi:tryptophanyl-tRNA synthetase
MKCVPPAGTYHRFSSGLQGGKMSSSDPKSIIALNESPKAAKKKIMIAKTGGRETVEEQKKKGGQPENCAIYELYLIHLIDDDLELSRIYNECRAGKLMCGDDKKTCADLVEKFLIKHQRKAEKSEKKAAKIIGPV